MDCIQKKIRRDKKIFIQKKFIALLTAKREDKGITIKEIYTLIGMKKSTMVNKLYRPELYFFTMEEMVLISIFLEIDLNRLKK